MIKVVTGELREAVKHIDVPKVQEYVAEYRNKCMGLWFSNTHDELEDFLRLLEQNFARVDRSLGEASDREMIFCYAGMMKGILQVLRQMLKEEGMWMWKSWRRSRAQKQTESCYACTTTAAAWECVMGSWQRLQTCPAAP